jgi:phage tail sheath gpL-like
MGISFSQIPSTRKSPGSYTEFDASGALQGSPAKPIHVLLIGHKILSGGSGSLSTVYPITGKNGGDAIFGPRAQTAAMARAFKVVAPFVQLSGVALDDGASGVAATGSIAITGPASASGVLALYVCGTYVPVTVTSGDSASTIATAIAAAITASPYLPVSAAADSGSVTVTALWEGPSGNDIIIEKNRNPEDATPAGVGCTITALANGAVSPAIGTFLATLPADVAYDIVVTGDSAAASMTSLETEASARWDALDQRSMRIHAGVRGNYSTASTYLSSRNSQYATAHLSGLSPTPPWIWAAVGAAIDAKEADAARPLNTLPYTGCVPALTTSRFSDDELELLLNLGGSTHKVDASNTPIVQRMVTTYTLNASSVPDPTFLDITTPKTLDYLRWSWNARLTTKFPRHKAANDGARPIPGQPIVTPSTLRGEAISWADDMYQLGLIEDLEGFAESLVVERNAQDANRFDVLMSPDLVNGAHIFATKNAFRL